MKKSADKNTDLQGEISADFDEAEKLVTRLDRYAVAHHHSLSVATNIRTTFPVERSSKNWTLEQYRQQKKAVENVSTAKALEDCGSFLVFRDYYTVGKIRLSAANFCRVHLLCQLCAIRRGAKSLKAYTDRLAVILQDNPKLKPYLVTLTTKNGPDLAERYGHFKRSYKRLVNRRREAMKIKKHGWSVRPIEMNKAFGGVSSIEIKRGSGSGEWHVHQHSVWLCEEEPLQKELAAEWQEMTGDSFIVDVRPFTGTSTEDYLAGFMEVFKYSVKFSSMEFSDTWQAYELLTGERLINSFGNFRGVVVPEEMTDELLDDLPYIEMVYRYIEGAGYSFQIDHMDAQAS